MSSQPVIEIDDAIRAEIYANAVFPAQGTRPLFSSVQALLSATLVAVTLWALELGAGPGETLRVTLAGDRRQFRATGTGTSSCSRRASS